MALGGSMAVPGRGAPADRARARDASARARSADPRPPLLPAGRPEAGHRVRAQPARVAGDLTAARPARARAGGRGLPRGGWARRAVAPAPAELRQDLARARRPAAALRAEPRRGGLRGVRRGAGHRRRPHGLAGWLRRGALRALARRDPGERRSSRRRASGPRAASAAAARAGRRPAPGDEPDAAPPRTWGALLARRRASCRRARSSTCCCASSTSARSASSYLDLARRTTLLAERAFDDGRRDDAFRVFQRLAAHASEKTTERSRDVAQGFLRSLLEGPRLEHVIQRALSGLEAGDLEANQVLLALGDATVPALLDAASSLEKGVERERLRRHGRDLRRARAPGRAERLGAQKTRRRACAPRSASRASSSIPTWSSRSAPARGRRTQRAGGSGARRSCTSARTPRSRRSPRCSEAPRPGSRSSALHGLGSTASARAVEPSAPRARARARGARYGARARR